jgi:hypothetical protein
MKDSIRPLDCIPNRIPIPDIGQQHLNLARKPLT